MDECVGIIKGYYTNLKYNIKEKKKEALKKIFDLSSELKFEEPNNYANRFSKTLSIIQDNFSHFVSACEHIDVANNIIDYVKHFSVQLSHDMTGEFTTKNEQIASLMLTINNISLEPKVQNFLGNALIKGSEAEDVILKMYKGLGSSSLQYIEMILLEDIDLHSFMDCLKNENVVSSLNKIWVQISIEQDFQWHIKKCFGHLSVPIKIFQSKQELFTSEDFTTEIKITSIWSENVRGAQNLASSLKRHIIFINTHMNFCAGIILPYTKILYDPRVAFNLDENNKIAKYDNKYILCSEDEDKNYIEYAVFDRSNNKCYDMFYDGKWQKPVRNEYWVQNNTLLLANATSEDYEKCKASAKQGFKIWSNEAIHSRIYVLSQLAAILKSKCESSLADVVSMWLKLPYFCTDLLTPHGKTEQFEITKIREPRGIIVLKEKDKVTMFREITQSLITGNSIIVICDPDLCTLAPYCDMFSTAKIPPGVINLLSSKYIKYANYDNRFGELNAQQAYVYFTASKHIVVSLK